MSYELSYQIFRLIANSPLHAKKPNVSEQGSVVLARAAYDGYRVARNGSKSKQAVVVVERSQTSHLKLNLVQFPTMINGEDRWEQCIRHLFFLTFPPPQVSQRTKGVPLPLPDAEDAKMRRSRRCIFGTNDEQASTSGFPPISSSQRELTSGILKCQLRFAYLFVCLFCAFFCVSASHDARGPTADCN